jgi:hypothetical protein
MCDPKQGQVPKPRQLYPASFFQMSPPTKRLTPQLHHPPLGRPQVRRGPLLALLAMQTIQPSPRAAWLQQGYSARRSVKERPPFAPLFQHVQRHTRCAPDKDTLHRSMAAPRPSAQVIGSKNTETCAHAPKHRPLQAPSRWKIRLGCVRFHLISWERAPTPLLLSAKVALATYTHLVSTYIRTTRVFAGSCGR